MFNKLKEIIINRSFILGIALAIGIFSKYIFGDDNLAEELAEVFIKAETGQQIDFSSPAINDIMKDYREDEVIKKGY